MRKKITFHRLRLFLLSLVFVSVGLADIQNLYVAPKHTGEADGNSLENPISYLDMDFWETVNKGLEETEIMVWFTDGQYSHGGLHLTDVGNDKNRLTIKGITPEGVIMNSPVGTMLRFSGCKNILVENLNFTGLIKGYCLVIGKNEEGKPSNNIVVKGCSFIDLPELFYGCFGAHYGSYDITLQDSVFKRTGSDIFCHQVYNAYGVRNVNLINNHFEDSSGSYVRYRDDSDYAIISGNTFVSTGNSVKYGEREIFLELYATNTRGRKHELLGTNFKITDNKFNFCEKESDIRFGMRILASGVNPATEEPWLNTEEIKILENGSTTQRKRIMLRNFGINVNKIQFKDNIWNGEDWKVGIQSSQGCKIDLSGLFKFEPRSPETQMSDILGDYEIRFYESGVEYHFYEDVPYLGADRAEKLDIYSPVSTISHPRPAALIIHGGGWSGGNRNAPRQYEFAEFMVERGYVAVNISYKLTEYEGKPWRSKRIKGAWPQNIYDCKSALRFMKTGILNIDPQRIVVMGGSAGGHLAMLTGLSADSEQLNSGGLYTEQDNSVNCIINFYGIPDVRRWGGRSFIDEPFNEYPEIWALASPVEHLSENSPPILVFHGTDDQTVDIKLSEEFVGILKEKGLPHKYVVVEDGPHTFALTVNDMDLRPFIEEFLKENFAGDIEF